MIGLFDSGLGGLTVLAAYRALGGEADVAYLGDTAHLPYGNRSARAVSRLSLAAARFLLSRGVSSVVVACSTASSLALGALRSTLPVPVGGVLEHGARAAASGGLIGVIGTRATVASDAYGAEIRRLNPSARVVSVACPLFVSLVEEGLVDGEIVERVVERYCAPLAEAGIDTLLLGCTHYGFLAPALTAFFGEGVRVVDPSRECAARMPREEGSAETRLFLTDLPPGYAEQIARFLGAECEVTAVDVE